MTNPHRLEHQGSEWIEQIRQGDEVAFEALFRAFAPGLCAFIARYVGSRAIAEELVQDLFLSLWRKRSELVVRQAVTTYLFTAARNRALNYLGRERTAKQWRASLRRADDPDPSAPSEGELLEMLELQDAIERLPARCRLIFTLNRQQEMTYGEIATSLGLSIKTVETQMGRALKALRGRLKPLLP
ncbi:MAG: RNA polymerase sigma-70 factor [Gemmatimonadaceae bacterium]